MDAGTYIWVRCCGFFDFEAVNRLQKCFSPLLAWKQRYANGSQNQRWHVLTLTAGSYQNAVPDGPAQVSATRAFPCTIHGEFPSVAMAQASAENFPRPRLKKSTTKHCSNWGNTVFHGPSCLEKIVPPLFYHILASLYSTTGKWWQDHKKAGWKSVKLNLERNPEPIGLIGGNEKWNHISTRKVK